MENLLWYRKAAISRAFELRYCPMPIEASPGKSVVMRRNPGQLRRRAVSSGRNRWPGPASDLPVLPRRHRRYDRPSNREAAPAAAFHNHHPGILPAMNHREQQIMSYPARFLLEIRPGLEPILIQVNRFREKAVYAAKPPADPIIDIVETGNDTI
jgi:hypothetical protein